jgi:hypothetical protein
MLHADNSALAQSFQRAIRHARSVLSLEDLARLYWLSGSTCAGKSSTSSEVAGALKWAVYHVDDWERDQGKRADPKLHRNWFRYSRMTGDELWLQAVGEHLVIQSLSATEQFEMVVDDLALWLARSEKALIYDGFVSPAITRELIPDSHHAFYLVASEEFQREHYRRRPWIKEVLAKTTDPDKAWENWMARDAASARALEETLKTTSLSWMLVDGAKSLEQTVNLVLRHFAKVGAV